jgi:hypothetical protein
VFGDRRIDLTLALATELQTDDFLKNVFDSAIEIQSAIQ